MTPKLLKELTRLRKNCWEAKDKLSSAEIILATFEICYADEILELQKDMDID